MGFFGKPDGITVHIDLGLPKRSQMTSKWKLNNCPNCGASQADRKVELWWVGASKEYSGWRVLCSECLYMPAALCKADEEAVNLWNETRLE